MRIVFIIFLVFVTRDAISQSDSVFKSVKIPFDTNRIKEPALLSNSSDVFKYDSLYIWNDKRTLSEIMNERSGFFTSDFGLGGRNLISYNGYLNGNIGIFRDGIQINDILFGGFDIQNISVNEIEKIEEVSNTSSFLYGNSTNGKTLNIITKDVFRSKPFSQLRYSQDRFSSLYADVVFNLPFTKKLNWMAGATSHSSDGRYLNSEYTFWRGRTRLSYYHSPSFNAKINFYYDNLKRGLDEGLIYNSDEDSLEENTAAVMNETSNEKLENFFYDATLTGKFFRNPESLTSLILYSSNSIRRYYNDYFLTVKQDTNNPVSPPSDYHSVQYGISFSQNINYDFSRRAGIDVKAGANVYFNSYNYSNTAFDKKDNTAYLAFLKTDFKYDNLNLSVFANAVSNGSIADINAGMEGKYRINFGKNNYAGIFGGINRIEQNPGSTGTGGFLTQKINESGEYYESGAEFCFLGKIFLNSYYYFNDNQYSSGSGLYFSNGGVNTALSILTKYIDAVVKYNYTKSDFFPENFIKSDIAYHDFLFRNKLNLRTGFNIKYFSSPKNYYRYSQGYYNFLYLSSPYSMSGFQIDYYLGARIGHANINLTIANILNTFYYDTYLYPADNLGGFLNSISRFTIVWDFLN